VPNRDDLRASTLSELAARINAEIPVHGPTVDKFAARLGCQRQRVILWRKAESKPSEGYVAKLAAVTGRPEDWFRLRGEGTPSQEQQAARIRRLERRADRMEAVLTELVEVARRGGLSVP
jgi:transcriptional regulator with XRE-family HTH domain